MLKAPEAVDVLIAALEIESLREDTAHALGDIGDPRAVPALAAQLEPEPPLFVGNAIWNALKSIGTPEAKAAIAAWEARGESPPDAHDWVARPAAGGGSGTGLSAGTLRLARAAQPRSAKKVVQALGSRPGF